MSSGVPRSFTRPSFSIQNSFKKLFAKRSRRRVCLVGLLLAIGGCAILPGHWRPGWNKEWTSKEPVPQTAGSWNLSELETKEEEAARRTSVPPSCLNSNNASCLNRSM